MTEHARATADGNALVVTVAPWPDDAVAPVCLMVDDLTDGWIDEDGRGRPLGRNDWGAGLDAQGSSFAFLRDRVLASFPEVRTTFFIPVDRMEDVRPSRFPFEFRPIDRRPEFARFLRDLAEDPRFECSFHGTQHGLPGATAAAYTPEFELHASVPEMLAALHAGAQVWKAVFGAPPAGGKYPAYARGPHGDAAVDQAGFSWWCRRWDRGLAEPGDDAAFQPRFFGERGVVDVPSTLHGGMLTLPPRSAVGLRGVPYYLLTALRAPAWLDAQLDALLASRAVITVQEHITSSRPDGDVQTPNVYDDVRTLRRIFTRLRRERVWHATCGEIAAYFRTRELTRVHVRGDRAFEVRRPAAEGPWAPLSLALSGCALPDGFALRGPRGELAARVSRRTGVHGCVLAPIALEPGRYEIP